MRKLGSVPKPGPGPGLYRYAQMLVQAAGRLKYTQETIERSTLQELINLTPAEVKARAQDVRPIAKYYETGSKDDFKRTHRKYPTIYNQVRMYFRVSKPRKKSKKTRHQSIIRFFGPPSADSQCWVWCDCEYFTYTLEVALAKMNSSAVENSNGEAPIIRNPGNLGFLCKHLVKAADWALSQRRDLAAEKMKAEIAKEEKAKGKETQKEKPGVKRPPKK